MVLRKIGLVAALAIFLFTSFAFPTENAIGNNKAVYTDYRLTYVKIRKMTGKEKRTIKAEHPAQIERRMLANLLSSIRLSRRAFFKKEKVVDDRAIFDDSTLQSLGEYFAAALAQAKDNQLITFSFIYKNPKFFIRNDRLTTGLMWVEGGALHVEFNKVFAKMPDDTSKRGFYITRAANKAESVRVILEVQPGQMLAEDNSKEMILPLKGEFAERVASQAATVDAEAGDTGTRLKKIERLKEMGLISQEEYEVKRREILGKI